MEKNDSFFKTFPIVWIVTIIVGVLLWVLGSSSWGLSFILGSVTSLMMMSMLYKSSKNVLEQDTKIKAQRLATRNYFFRYFFYAVILVAAGVHPNLHILFTGAGLFVFKIVFYIVLFIDGRGEIKHD
jgi:hypothetical protein